MELSDDIAKQKHDLQLRKLAIGGSGGCIRHGCVNDDNSQALLVSQWKFKTPIEKKT